MIVVGVDPGTRVTGYAFLEKRTNRIRVLGYGVIRCSGAITLPERLGRIHDGLKGLMETYSPQTMALENVFFAKYPRAALVLGHARGAIMVAARSLEVQVFEYPPSLVKQAATGKGSASKDQVSAMIQSHLQLKTPPTPSDAADALAVAFCHLIRNGAVNPD